MSGRKMLLPVWMRRERKSAFAVTQAFQRHSEEAMAARKKAAKKAATKAAPSKSSSEVGRLRTEARRTRGRSGGQSPKASAKQRHAEKLDHAADELESSARQKLQVPPHNKH